MAEHQPIIYSNRILYQIAIRLLYGRHFQDRYRALAGMIPGQSSVVELCCGDCYLLTHYLGAKQVNYLGLDKSSQFISPAQKRGINVRQFDVRVDPIPAGDIIMMQGSLYQFIPFADQVIRRMLASARQKVLIAEPILNLATSANPILFAIRRLIVRFSWGANSASARRFDRQSLLDLFRSFESFEDYLVIPGGRELIGIFRKKPAPIMQVNKGY